MRHAAASLFVFLGGFALMVLEIVGTRLLGKHFGASFYVWISQIGVILVALAVGYYVGGTLADRFQRGAFLSWLLAPAAIYTFLIPSFSAPLMDAIVMRHPADEPIPLLWQKLDPAVGSALIFFLPCFVLATLSPYTIRLAAQHLGQVGRVSGLVYAASTAGSIVGVFLSGYVLIDHLPLLVIFRATGGLILALALASLKLDRWLRLV